MGRGRVPKETGIAIGMGQARVGPTQPPSALICALFEFDMIVALRCVQCSGWLRRASAPAAPALCPLHPHPLGVPGEEITRRHDITALGTFVTVRSGLAIREVQSPGVPPKFRARSKVHIHSTKACVTRPARQKLKAEGQAGVGQLDGREKGVRRRKSAAAY